jgi:hypothetical protein
MLDTKDTKPYRLNSAEWKEIFAVPAVRDAWGIFADETAEQFASGVYAAKFKFSSGSPGYVGDLFILQGRRSDRLPTRCSSPR